MPQAGRFDDRGGHEMSPPQEMICPGYMLRQSIYIAKLRTVADLKKNVIRRGTNTILPAVTQVAMQSFTPRI